MKSINLLSVCMALLSFTAINAQISNAKTDDVKIYGNCGMCESTIEKAGNVKNEAEVDWNKDTKMATITYDTIKTSQDEVLKRIALAGYDSDKFLAPDDVYAKLAGCCQYERANKSEKADDGGMGNHSMHGADGTTNKPSPSKQELNQLKAVFDNYFALKDALVASDGSSASSEAKKLLNALNDVKMNQLSSEAHNIWMKEMKDLASDTESMMKTKDVELQRSFFDSLSDSMYELLKVSKQDSSIYYQHCPMANDGKGADWLSKEKAIKNPYYGSQMLTCGKTMETFEN